MRTTPLVGTKVWFAPRLLGWGWAPVSPEGWAVTLICTLIIVLPMIVGDPANPAGPIVGVGLLLIVCVLKGSTPGGPAARQKFRTLQGFDQPDP